MIIIHSCNKRLWYVKDFLLPALRQQGILNAKLWNDDKGQGNLKSWMGACLWIREHMPIDGGVWHLQDDVLLASDFAKRIGDMPKDIVCNGYVCAGPPDDECRCVGFQKVPEYWMSFSCCYIPNRYIYGFVDWFYSDVLQTGKYAQKVQAGLYDDFFFWQYMKIKHKTDTILNVVPNLVQHVDYLLGGSVANAKKHMRKPACYWTEPEREKELEKRILEYGKTKD